MSGKITTSEIQAAVRAWYCQPEWACVFCPYRTDHEWRWLKEHDPEAFAQAVAIDKLARQTLGVRETEFVHRSLKPLDEVDFSTAEDRGQGSMLDICEGGCGV